MPSINDWIQLFKDKPRAEKNLEKDYGKYYPHLENKRNLLLELLEFHKSQLGNDDIIIVRAPGRLNLMGRHIDHQGGNVNVIAIDKEFFITASKREDNKIIAHNLGSSEFQPIEYDPSLNNLIAEEEWQKLINNFTLMESLRSPPGDWENYFKAAMLKLLHAYPDKELYGANMCVVGTIPIAAGLSSSSALITGILRALLALNHIKIADYEFIKLCSEAEWFVGTRGGASDHAAIVLGLIGKLSNVSFFPLQLRDYYDLPNDYDILLFNSNILADKSGTKKEHFNFNVMAYDIGLKIIQNTFPEYNDKIQHVKDINSRNLSISETQLFEILKSIPEYINTEDLTNLLGKFWAEIKKKYSFHTLPKTIPLRKILAYGISECERSSLFPLLLENREYETAGYLMNISHNGDRIVEFTKDFFEKPFNNELTDEDLESIINENVKLKFISGGYGCSIPNIDFIIDLALNSKGVLGAQLSGAGLGGSAMIFAKSGALIELANNLKAAYKETYGLECSLFQVVAVNGCSVYKEIEFESVIRDEYKNIEHIIIDNKIKRFRYECIRCGDCCRAGFEILIHADDAKRFIQHKKTDYVQYFEIDPKCISEQGLGGFHIEEANVLKRLKEGYNGEDYRIILEELKEFIDSKHIYLGESIYPLPIYTVFENYGRNPIIIPKSFVIMKDGWKKWGLVYRISFGTSRACHFLKDNVCSIHEIKPFECQVFPYDKEGNLRKDNHVLRICKGYKEI